MDYAEELLGAQPTKPKEQLGQRSYDYAEILNAPVAPKTTGMYESGQPPAGFAHEPTSGSGMGFVGGLEANIPSDPQTRLKIVADKLFPGDPNGMKRVGMRGGRLVFVNNKGDLEYADSGLLTKLGSATANLPELAGSVAGSFASPVVGTAIGGAGGKAWKQVLSNFLFGEPQSAGGNAAGLAVEGGVNAATAGLAKGAGAIYSRNAVRNAETFDKATADKLIDRIYQSTGIKLDYAQASNMPQLRNLKKWAAKFPSEAQDIIDTMDKTQADQVAGAIETKILGALSKESDPAALASSGVNAARAAIDMAKMKRSAETRAAYAKADQVILDGDVANGFKADPFYSQQLTRVIGNKLYQSEFNDVGIEPIVRDRSIKAWDLVLRNIRDQESAAVRAGENNKARLLGQRATKLEDGLAAANPDYAAARQLWAEKSAQYVAPLENGTIGVLAKIEGPKMTQTAAGVINDLLANPQAVTAVRLGLKNAKNGDQAWNDVLKLSLTNAFNKASKETQAGEALNVAGKFRQAVMGTPAQKQAMTNAIGSTGVQSFDDIMEAVQLIAKDIRNRPASDTASFQEVARQMQDRAKGFFKSAGVSALRAANPLDWADTLESIGRGRVLQDNAVRIAEALSDPKKIQKLSELRKLKPSPERAMAILSVAGIGTPLKEEASRLSSPEIAPQASPEQH